MHYGKVVRLQTWLAEQSLPAGLLAEAVFYSDSSNDLPLLEAVAEPVIIDPDPSLRRHADLAGWPIVELAR